MPDIRDRSTVEAIAREFTSNGRNAELALKTVGYADNTAEHMSKDIMSKLVVKEAIKRIDDKIVAKFELKAEKVLDRLCKISGLIATTGDDIELPSTTDAGQIRSLDLLGKHLKLWDRQLESKGSTDDEPQTEQEIEASKAAAKAYKEAMSRSNVRLSQPRQGVKRENTA